MRTLATALVVALIALAGTAAPTGQARAQIVNVQPLLTPMGEEGFKGQFDASFVLRTGNVQLLLFNSGLLMRYQTGWHRFISSTSGGLGYKGGTEEEDKFIQNVFEHLRWQWSLSELITLEAFGQVAHDDIKTIELRGLGGAGIRFEFLPGPAVIAAMGIAYMFEYENYKTRTGYIEAPDENAHRASLYLTGKFSVEPLLTLYGTLYYQPRLTEFVDDWRIAGDVGIAVKMNDTLSINITFSLAYDAAPPYTEDNVDPTATEVDSPIEELDTSTNVALGVSF